MNAHGRLEVPLHAFLTLMLDNVSGYIWSAKVCQKSRNRLKILSARMVTRSKFRTEYPQTSGTQYKI